MYNINYAIIDKDGLKNAIKRLSSFQFTSIANKSLTEMFNRAAQDTPVDTGELRLSRAVTKVQGSDVFEGEFGYSKEYAPHVEYGHRTRSGGFVQGQKFLARIVEAQQPIFERDIFSALRKETK